MAKNNYFGVNSGQANAAYSEILKNLDDIVTSNAGKENQDNPMQGPRHEQNGTSARTPWVMSTTEWLLQSPPQAIVWFANPSDVSWSMPQRATHTKTAIGTVLHVWPNTARGTFFDEARITLTLQTGNLMPVVGKPSSKWEASGGIVNFYDFMQLVDAPKLTVGTKTSPPRANLVSIQYSSNLFPKLTLLGMFDPSGIKFSDSAASPASVTSWSVDFIVYDTVPKLATNSGESFNAKLLQNWVDVKIGNRGAQSTSQTALSSGVPVSEAFV